MGKCSPCTDCASLFKINKDDGSIVWSKNLTGDVEAVYKHNDRIYASVNSFPYRSIFYDTYDIIVLDLNGHIIEEECIAVFPKDTRTTSSEQGIQNPYVFRAFSELFVFDSGDDKYIIGIVDNYVYQIINKKVKSIQEIFSQDKVLNGQTLEFICAESVYFNTTGIKIEIGEDYIKYIKHNPLDYVLDAELPTKPEVLVLDVENNKYILLHSDIPNSAYQGSDYLYNTTEGPDFISFAFNVPLAELIYVYHGVVSKPFVYTDNKKFDTYGGVTSTGHFTKNALAGEPSTFQEAQLTDYGTVLFTGAKATKVPIFKIAKLNLITFDYTYDSVTCTQDFDILESYIDKSLIEGVNYNISPLIQNYFGGASQTFGNLRQNDLEFNNSVDCGYYKTPSFNEGTIINLSEGNPEPTLYEFLDSIIDECSVEAKAVNIKFDKISKSYDNNEFVFNAIMTAEYKIYSNIFMLKLMPFESVEIAHPFFGVFGYGSRRMAWISGDKKSIYGSITLSSKVLIRLDKISKQYTVQIDDDIDNVNYSSYEEGSLNWNEAIPLFRYASRYTTTGFIPPSSGYVPEYEPIIDVTLPSPNMTIDSQRYNITQITPSLPPVITYLPLPPMNIHIGPFPDFVSTDEYVLKTGDSEISTFMKYNFTYRGFEYQSENAIYNPSSSTIVNNNGYIVKTNLFNEMRINAKERYRLLTQDNLDNRDCYLVFNTDDGDELVEFGNSNWYLVGQSDFHIYGLFYNYNWFGIDKVLSYSVMINGVPYFLEINIDSTRTQDIIDFLMNYGCTVNLEVIKNGPLITEPLVFKYDSPDYDLTFSLLSTPYEKEKYNILKFKNGALDWKSSFLMQPRKLTDFTEENREFNDYGHDKYPLDVHQDNNFLYIGTQKRRKIKDNRPKDEYEVSIEESILASRDCGELSNAKFKGIIS